MQFPYYLHIGPWNIHPHVLMEALAYFIGGRIYWTCKRPSPMSAVHAIWIVAGAAAGAAFLSKALCWFEDPHRLLTYWNEWRFWMSGKTIVGGLLGGLIGVEAVKKSIGWKHSTGDDFVFPLIFGIAIGRIGCFLTGLSDNTYGIPTQLPIGVDFGDGIPRHPTQLYEIGFLLILAAAVTIWNRRLRRSGQAFYDGFKFQLFMFAYLMFRFFIDFIKPTPHPYAGLNNIQMACLLGMLYYMTVWNKIRASHEREHRHA